MGFPRDFEVGERRRQEARMLDVSRGSIRWERQSSLMEVFREVGYAEGEKRLVWDLPGHGSAYVDCGTVKVKGCDHVEDHANGRVFGRYFKRTCRRKRCPTCFEGWAASEGERATVRLASFLYGRGHVQEVVGRIQGNNAVQPKKIVHQKLVAALEKLMGVSRKKVIHVVLSPGEGEVSEEVKGFGRVREKAYRLAKKSGVYGGAMVFHPYRLKCRECKVAIPDYMRECPECHGTEFQWFWSPHFHVVGFGWVHHTKEGFLEHGWVVKNLGVRENVFWTFQYLLSHAGVSGLHATTWFGSLAYNVLRHVARVGSFIELCPFCRRALQPLEWVSPDRPPPMPPELSRDPFENEFLADAGLWRHS